MKVPIVSILALYLLGCQSPQRPQEELVALMQEANRDFNNTDRRTRVSSDHLGQFLGDPFWRAVFPLRYYAYGKLLVKGNAIIPDLYAIATDPTKGESVRYSAWMFIGDLNGFDEPGMLAKLLEENRQGRLSAYDLSSLVSAQLPANDWLDVVPLSGTEFVNWLSNELRTKSYEQIVLSLLDERMKPKRHNLMPGDPYFRHYLNRMTDRDLDEWFLEQSPAAYRFRQKELVTKKYDPIGWLYWYLNGLEDSELDSGLKALFTDPEDRHGCREMVEHINGIQVGWENRLRAWYKANRPFFVYDHEKHRFVVNKPAASLPQ